MKTFKKILLWVVIIIILYIATDFANFYIMALNYQNIETNIEDSNTINIELVEAKATYVNGYAKINIKNNSKNEIINKYVMLEAYSEYNTCLTNKYIKIDSLKQDELKTLQFNFKVQEVKKVKIYISDVEPEKSKFELNEEIDGPAILTTAIIFLYFFG